MEVSAPPRERLAAILRIDPGPPIGASYALRTASAAAIAYALYRLLGAQIGIWAVVSAIVVIMPEVKASIPSAALRTSANIVGASIGALVALAIGAYAIPALVTAMLLVAVACRLLRIDAAARSASVSAAIVLLKDPSGTLGSSAMRIEGVLIGCGVALLVTVVAALIERIPALSRR
jgi:uncharacterized membrane protein YgaE (UPF0421/DUF939 family)